MDRLREFLSIAPEVQKALDAEKPVVTFESTVIAHDMPYPQNVQAALRVKQIIRDNGAVPAPIAILGGKLHIGLEDGEVEYLGKKGAAVPKASRRDIPVLAARGEDGATTLAATLILAALAGIKVVATGGMGGVHRGAQATMDISADLEEIAHTSALVVSAGVKSILDIGMTLEYLETRGVPVVGFGREDFPAFYHRQSGYKLGYRADSPGELARMFYTKEALAMPGGFLVANPIPAQYALDGGTITSAITAAVEEASHSNVTGKELTPFLLERIRNITGGKSLEAHTQLMYNNALLASQVASELALL